MSTNEQINDQPDNHSQPQGSTPKYLQPYSLKDLEKFYFDDEGCDKSIFAEMRSNVLLYAGEHYHKRDSNFFRRIRTANDLPDEQKVRLTKNHIQKICKIYSNHIMAAAPGVGFRPKNQGELQHQKAAELHHSVWNHLKEVYKLEDMLYEECDDFVQVGEVFCKVFYDTSQGPVIGYESLVGEDGQPQIDEFGQPQPDQDKPVYRGKFIFEKIFGFNVLRPVECLDIRESARLTIRKMVDVGVLKAQFPQFADKINTTMRDTYIIFEPAQQGYRNSENEVLVRETYIRPCPRYPKGHYFIHTRQLILAEDDLPGGIFPIVCQVFERSQTLARGRSPIKTMRPYQVEINRAASKMAEHQITLGDDKILLVNGSKISAGASLPGVRTANVTGQEPVILAGRDGSQYLNYMNATIDELYAVMMVQEVEAPDTGQYEPFAMLYMAASKKKSFQRFIKRFEQYLVDKVKLTLSLAKEFMPEDEVIQAIGKPEQVNISEFKNSHDLDYEILVEPQDEDVETKIGQQFAINQVIQYAGGKLEKEDIGRLMRNMPYGNFEKAIDDWTMAYDSGTNLILALDRGEQPVINQFDDPIYMIKRLVSRMRQADFKMLNPQVQQTYQAALTQYEQIQAQQVQAQQAAEAGLIPHSGYMVVCDLYVSDPAAPDKTRRARVPYDSLAWLIQKLEDQGKTLNDLENMNQAALGQMSTMIQQRQQAGVHNGMGMPAHPGAGMPGKVAHGNAGPAGNRQQLPGNIAPPGHASLGQPSASPGATQPGGPVPI